MKYRNKVKKELAKTMHEEGRKEAKKDSKNENEITDETYFRMAQTSKKSVKETLLIVPA